VGRAALHFFDVDESARGLEVALQTGDVEQTAEGGRVLGLASRNLKIVGDQPVNEGFVQDDVGVAQQGGEVVRARAEQRVLKIDDPDAAVGHHEIPTVIIAVDQHGRRHGQLFGDSSETTPNRLPRRGRQADPVSGFDAVFQKMIELPEQERVIEPPPEGEAARWIGVGIGCLEPDEFVDRLPIQRLHPFGGRSRDRVPEREVPEVFQEESPAVPIVIMDARDAEAPRAQIALNVEKRQFDDGQIGGRDGLFGPLKRLGFGKFHEDEGGRCAAGGQVDLEYVRFEASPLRRSHRTIGVENPDRRINSSRAAGRLRRVGVQRVCGCGPFIDRDSAMPPSLSNKSSCRREAGTVSEPPRMWFYRGSGDAGVFLSGAAARFANSLHPSEDVPWRSIGQIPTHDTPRRREGIGLHSGRRVRSVATSGTPYRRPLPAADGDRRRWIEAQVDRVSGTTLATTLGRGATVCTPSSTWRR
jgi:hypothetical protein